jgi:Holliday junction resolvasome RuvABC endonuclease subunit
MATEIMKVYIGIDPGSASGCIALIYISDKGNICHTETIEFAKNTTKEWFEELKSHISPYSESFAILEKVHGMPGMGVQSISAFMKNVGHIEMALLALRIPFKEVTPQAWMKHYNLKKEKDESKPDWKRRLRERLQRIMPEFKVNNSNADAMLIAYYAALNY